MAESRSMTTAEVVAKTLIDEHADFLAEAVAIVAAQLMEAEITTEIGAARGEVSPDRQTHRNGYRERRWETRVQGVGATGLISDPRLLPTLTDATAYLLPICYRSDSSQALRAMLPMFGPDPPIALHERDWRQMTQVDADTVAMGAAGLEPATSSLSSGLRRFRRLSSFGVFGSSKPFSAVQGAQRFRPHSALVLSLYCHPVPLMKRLDRERVEDVRWLAARRSDDGQTVRLAVSGSSSERPEEVRVRMTETEVGLLLRLRVPEVGLMNLTLHCAEIELDEPVGDRRIVDDAPRRSRRGEGSATVANRFLADARCIRVPIVTR